MLQQHAPVCMVSYGKVTVVKVPMDINTFVQDRPRSSPTMPVSNDLARCLLVCLTNTQLIVYISLPWCWRKPRSRSEETKYACSLVRTNSRQRSAMAKTVLKLPETAKIYRFFFKEVTLPWLANVMTCPPSNSGIYRLEVRNKSGYCNFA